MTGLQRLREALDLVEATRHDPISIYYSRMDHPVRVMLHAADMLDLVDERAIAADLVAYHSATSSTVEAREGVVTWVAVVPTPPTHEAPIDLLRGGVA